MFSILGNSTLFSYVFLNFEFFRKDQKMFIEILISLKSKSGIKTLQVKYRDPQSILELLGVNMLTKIKFKTKVSIQILTY